MLDESKTQIDEISPGAHLKAEMARLRLDQSALAEELGVSRQVVNYVVNDRKRISRSLASSLSKMMNLPEDYWLRARYLDVPAHEQISEIAIVPNQDGFHGGVLVDFQIEESIKLGNFSIDPFLKENLKQASIDLTIDRTAMELDGSQFQLDDRKPYVLKPGEMLNLTTREEVYFKNGFLARVGATTSLSRQGIITLHGLQVDPGFSGKLQFCLKNLGISDFAIHLGDVCLSLEITALREAPRTKFTDPQGDRPATRKLLAERNSVSALFEVLEPHIVGLISTQSQNGDFESEIPGLYQSLMTFSTEEDSKAALLDEVNSLLVAVSENVRVRHAGDFKSNLKLLLGKINVDAEEAERILGIYGANPDPTCATAFVLDTDACATHVQLPPIGGKISLSKLLNQFGALRSLDDPAA